MGKEKLTIPLEVTTAFERKRLETEESNFWPPLFEQEMAYLRQRNQSLLLIMHDNQQSFAKYWQPFEKMRYFEGFFGMHCLARTSGMYTDISRTAITAYTDDFHIKIAEGMSVVLEWMEYSVNLLAPGALDAIRPGQEIYHIDIINAAPEGVMQMHRPEIVWGAADVILPIAYQLGIFTPPPNTEKVI